jgi:hypothetical protein
MPNSIHIRRTKGEGFNRTSSYLSSLFQSYKPCDYGGNCGCGERGQDRVVVAVVEVTAAGEEAAATRVWVRGTRGRDRTERADLSFFHHPGVQRGNQC